MAAESVTNQWKQASSEWLLSFYLSKLWWNCAWTYYTASVSHLQLVRLLVINQRNHRFPNPVATGPHVVGDDLLQCSCNASHAPRGRLIEKLRAVPIFRSNDLNAVHIDPRSPRPFFPAPGTIVAIRSFLAHTFGRREGKTLIIARQSVDTCADHPVCTVVQEEHVTIGS